MCPAACAYPPAASSASRRTAVHWPLIISRPVGHTRRGVGRAEAVDERDQQGRVQEPLARRVADEARAGADEVRRPRSAAASARARPGRGRVSASTLTHDVTARRLEPRCSAHGLPTHPAGGGPACTTRAPRARASSAVPSVEPSSTTITSCSVGIGEQAVQARADPGRLVARGDDDRDRPVERSAGGERRTPDPPTPEPRQHDRRRGRLG